MLIILLPAFNEEGSFEPLIPGIADALDKEGLEFKIIVCNDGSEDNLSLIHI